MSPCNLDWRGRVYPLPFFNFQRSDLVRALHLFADGEPIGEEGLWWLKVHVANCGDFDKVSKAPFEERVKWTEDNAAVIRAIAENPLAEVPLAMWSKADKPFLFLAACLEFSSALLRVGLSAFVSTLPLSWDGSCSGLQHLCAMTRAPEGAGQPDTLKKPLTFTRRSLTWWPRWCGRITPTAPPRTSWTSASTVRS
jgi:DNA-directed RNA polymerase